MQRVACAVVACFYIPRLETFNRPTGQKRTKEMLRRFATLTALLATLASVMLLVPCAAAAQVNSTTATVTLGLAVGESITVTPSLGTLPDFSYVAGASSSGVQSFTLTTAYQLAAGHAAFHVAFWVGSATAALSNGTTNIPAGDVLLAVNAVPGLGMDCARAADPVVPAAVSGQSCNVGINIALVSPFAGTRTDTINMQLANLPALISSGHYVGTLNIAAGAN